MTKITKSPSNLESKISVSRRNLFKLGIVSGIAIPMSALGQGPERARPQAGDTLVFEEGVYQGEAVTPALLELEQQPIAALARDPQTNVLRSGSRLNRVVVVKVDASKLEPRYRRYGADGVIAYSIVCTHTGCDVTNWDAGLLRMACPCHESQFDIYAGGKVVGGPAPRPLPMLPLKLEDGVVKVAAAFAGRVGFTQQF